MSSETTPIANILPEGIYLGQLSKSKLLEPITTGFEITNQNIQFKIDKLQDKKKTNQKHLTGFLRTAWIKVSDAKKDELRLTLTSESTDLNSDFFQGTLTVSSPDGSLISKNIKDLNGTQFHSFNLTSLPALSSYYQVTLKVALDLTKVNQENEFNLLLKQFTINDPCINNESHQPESCHQNGECIRNYDSFVPSCKCKTGYTEESWCEKINYCKWQVNGRSNGDICRAKGLDCKDDESLETFECVCKGKDEKWDLATQK